MQKPRINKAFNASTDALKSLSVFNPLTIRKKGTRAKALFALAVVCVLWGTTWIASKQGVRHMPSAIQLSGMRQLLGGLCYMIFFIAKGAQFPRGKELIPLLILALLNFVLSNGLSTWGLKYISSGLGAIMGAIFPLWIVIINLFGSKEKIPAKALLGLMIGFGGVCVIFYEHLQDFFDPNFRFGILISLVATWTWAFGSLYTKKQAANFNPYFGLGFQMLIAGTALLAISTTDKNFTPFTEIAWEAWAAIGYLVLFGSVIAFICYLYALQNLPTEQASIYAYVNPVVAVLFGVLIFHEKISFTLATGGLVALLGVYLVNKAYKKTAEEQRDVADN
jgi:drug/metabolite transporter (DMT)-like permease